MREYFLETERIGFSYWTEDDLALANSLWGEQEVTRYISKTGVFSETEIIDRLKLEIKNKEQFGVQYWPVFHREANEFIGCCGLRPYNTEQHIYEIGFHLKSKYWGKAFGQEAAKTVIQYAFEVLHANQLFAGHNPNNTVSKKVLERLGFCYIGDTYYPPTGLYHPSYQYTPCANKHNPMNKT